MLSDSLKLKAPSRIYILGLAKNPWYRTKTVSLDTSPHITVQQHSHFASPLFRLFCDVSSLDPINTKSVYLPQAFPICSYIPGITTMIPLLWVQFHFATRSALPSYSEQRKFESPMIPCPCSLFQCVSQSPDCLTPLVISLALLAKETPFPWSVVGIPLSMTKHVF